MLSRYIFRTGFSAKITFHNPRFLAPATPNGNVIASVTARYSNLRQRRTHSFRRAQAIEGTVGCTSGTTGTLFTLRLPLERKVQESVGKFRPARSRVARYYCASASKHSS